MKELARVELDTHPSTLIPHVDVDTGVCLLTAKVIPRLPTKKRLSTPCNTSFVP
jgi:hypothetical protein